MSHSPCSPVLRLDTTSTTNHFASPSTHSSGIMTTSSSTRSVASLEQPRHDVSSLGLASIPTITPSSSLRNITEMNLSTPSSGYGSPARSRAVSGASNVSVGNAMRHPLQSLPSPGTSDVGMGPTWGSFATLSENVVSDSLPPIPKPQGRKTLDFFATFSPPSIASSNSSTIASPNASPLPPPPLRAPVNTRSIRSARSSRESDFSMSSSPPDQTCSSTASTRSRQASFFSGSPNSSRDASPSRPNIRTSSLEIPLADDSVGPSRSVSKTEEFFGSPTTSPLATSFSSENLAPSPPLSTIMHRDPSLRTQLFTNPKPHVALLPTTTVSHAPERGTGGANGRPKMSSLPSVVLDPANSDSQEAGMRSLARLLETAKSNKAGKETSVGAILTDEENDAEEFLVLKDLGEGAFSKVLACQMRSKGNEGMETEASGKIVAVKMIERKAVEGNERMKSSVGREMGVLKHIHHPSLVSLLTSFQTPHHTALVLECAAGGELFDFIGDHHSQMEARVAKRIFGELCSVLGWMHSQGVVHRDVKLENVLLTQQIYHSGSAAASLPPASEPLIKLTDFGLSRFIDPASPLLSTRCGSEEYAAPELLMGKAYDGRLTDTWAAGVVGYALLVGWLPFTQAGTGGWSSAGSVGSAGSSSASSKARRSYLLKIAKADYTWPGDPETATRLATKEGKQVVDGLLKRDPAKRIKLAEVGGMDWWQVEEGMWEAIKGLESEAWGKRPAEGSEAARILAGEH